MKTQRRHSLFLVKFRREQWWGAVEDADRRRGAELAVGGEEELDGRLMSLLSTAPCSSLSPLAA
jgi:hypothetical protein